MFRLIHGGVEKSAINFLKAISKEDLDITFILEDSEGPYKKDIPDNIKVMEIPFKNKFWNIEKNKTFHRFNWYLSRLLLKIYCKIFHCNKNQFMEKVIDTKSIGEFDLAIDYQGYGCLGTTYIGKYVNAKKKAMFVHDENMTTFETAKYLYDNFDYFFGVSKHVCKVFKETFNIPKDKIDVCHNIIDYDEIINKSNEYTPEFDNSTFNMVTIGNLRSQKGYDILLEVAKLLKDNNYTFKWYIIGKGILKDKIQNEINKYNLNDYLILTGSIYNPYPYVKHCNLYVCTSRWEGYGLTIAEARCLNKPIVSTNLKCIEEQVIEGKNGFLCQLEPNEFYNKIKLFFDSKFYNEFMINYDSNIDYNDNLEYKKVLNLL